MRVVTGVMQVRAEIPERDDWCRDMGAVSPPRRSDPDGRTAIDDLISVAHVVYDNARIL